MRSVLDSFFDCLFEAQARQARRTRDRFVREAMADDTVTTREMPIIPMRELMADLDHATDEANFDLAQAVGRDLDRALRPASEWPDHALARLLRYVRGTQ